VIRVIGLTGGIATGKSTVSQILRELGAAVIDADVLAREVVEPGQPALAEVAARFPGVIGQDGRLDRAALGQRVFGDAAELSALNAILHPRIAEAFAQRTRELEAKGEPLVVYDAALLVENGLQARMQGLIVVVAPAEDQRRRLMARDGLSGAEADARIASQLPLSEKVKHATWVVDNSGGVESTRAQVERIYRTMKQG
jgi:dephospho-CoA kinase